MKPPVPTASEPAGASPRPRILAVLALLFAGIAAYHNMFDAPFVFDGPPSITENPSIQKLWPLRPVLSPPGAGLTVSGRPLLNLSLALNHAISGEAVWSYHAANLAIHLLAGLTLFGVARRTFLQPPLRPRFGASALPLGAAIAALWLLHPLQTAAVTYTIQRAESLAGLLYLLTLYGFIRSTQSPAHPRRWRWFSFTTCLLGMASKEVMVSAPLIVLLYDRTFVSGTFADAWRRHRLYHLALFSTWLLLAALVATTHNRGGTAGFGTAVSPLFYAQSQLHAIALYLKLSFWPNPLVFDYGITVIRHFRDVWPQALLLTALAGATLLAIRRRSALGFLGAGFFALLAPSSSIVPISTQTMAEHRMYLPLAAIVAISVTATHALLGRRGLALWPLVALAFAGLTVQRNETYRSDLQLWRDTVRKRPANSRAHHNLAMALSARQLRAEAIPHYQAALRLDDGGVTPDQTAALHTELAHHFALLGRVNEALPHFREALRLDPASATAHYNLAQALAELGARLEAIEHYREALRLNISHTDTPARLADALFREGRVEESLPVYREWLRLDPANAAGHNNFAYALLVAGHFEESIAAYRTALRLDPNHAPATFGRALLLAGRPHEAIDAARNTLRLDPTSAHALYVLGLGLAQTGRIDDAIASFNAALEIQPNAAEVHASLGDTLAAAGRPSEATAHREQAARLNSR